MKIIFLTTEGITSSVYKSQVYDYCNRLSSTHVVDILNLQNILSRFKVSDLEYLNKKIQKNYFYIYNYNLKYFINFTIKTALNKTQCNIIHARNPIAANIALKIKSYVKDYNVQILYDVRGYVEGEQTYFGNINKALMLKRINKTLFKTDIFYSFISNNLLELYTKTFDLNIKSENYIINPSSYNEHIFNLKKIRVSTNDRVRVIYMGGTQLYQQLNNITKFFDENISNIELHLAIKNNVKYTRSCRIHINKKPAYLIELLHSCDYGIIYRDSNYFNLVSTPTKITEYWGIGLKILVIGNAGSYTNEIKNSDGKLGYVFSDLDELRSFNFTKVSYTEKKYISNYVSEKYSMGKNINRYINFYEKISNVQ